MAEYRPIRYAWFTGVAVWGVLAVLATVFALAGVYYGDYPAAAVRFIFMAGLPWAIYHRSVVKYRAFPVIRTSEESIEVGKRVVRWDTVEVCNQNPDPLRQEEIGLIYKTDEGKAAVIVDLNAYEERVALLSEIRKYSAGKFELPPLPESRLAYAWMQVQGKLGAAVLLFLLTIIIFGIVALLSGVDLRRG